ncbi:MAG: DUF192 domain-containing protein [Burkholderiaceae bacterium]|nr:MAG: DUF192 domain-containing protein [Burkholderiaceae bacterium]
MTLQYWPYRWPTLLSSALISTLLLLPIGAASGQGLPILRLQAGIHLITAEVAGTDATRQRGLMYRDKLEPNQGMLFVFEEKALHCFWMRNTKIPLSIAFLADDGTIVNIADMQPFTENSHCAQKAVGLALEMQQGWFRQRGIKPGMKLGGFAQKQ